MAEEKGEGDNKKYDAGIHHKMDLQNSACMSNWIFLRKLYRLIVLNFNCLPYQFINSGKLMLYNVVSQICLQRG